MPTAALEICNKKGLHARAAAKFVKIVAACNAQVQVCKDGEETTVQGSSILGLMMLGADAGSRLHITAEGEDALKVIEELTDLVNNRFGEPE